MWLIWGYFSAQKSNCRNRAIVGLAFILSKEVFEVSSISSHTNAQPSTPRGRLPRRWHADADQTRSRSSQARFRFNDKTNGKRPTSQYTFWCVANFYKVQYEHVQEIWANAHETRDSISLISYARCLDLSPVYFSENSVYFSENSL